MISGWLADERMRTRTDGKGGGAGAVRGLVEQTESVGRKEYTSWCAEQRGGRAMRSGVAVAGCELVRLSLLLGKGGRREARYGPRATATPERTRAVDQHVQYGEK